ncbi:3-methylcrotonyl-CoA carboxylase alpha subunit [Pseudochelatococcus lubricantis]|uniref:3-methylcrotonyl-CoA carboxylase alpha subunit n=1 Tax=Pseudochelatococcus lubricantis TaxID=1538102 RepID=A0ABX0UX34_9HYPH|nr:acetyl/propionyl/methylcrotonyl-CoA carboxylase subunit alpha [Pseudochelatococcus lubricantis]NIJ56968.1 3-methylcrotonyl-CoA carboxylase alpha subunit [Pseudochelatococcus lubricantis]
MTQQEIRKILIANRGEIACRVAATARRLAIRTVAVHSDVDARARFVAACDEAVSLGGAAPKDSYLRQDKIIAAAKATGADAIHPGYGFLSENAEFAAACAQAGLVFIGPPASAIAAMGLKAESKRLMEAAGVPLVPGYHGAEQDFDLLAAEAERIGYPLMIKASAGGGGKGMRIVEAHEDFAENLASCQREAIASFGSAAVLIERYVQRPRHIEIQVFGDSHGNYVYLFERDCSVQRRHQKVLEEAPAPGLGAARRREMGEAAIAAARAVGYVGAGTVEFIAEPAADGDIDFYFMEMNTRLQVEHPVTEAITGLDLVEWQIRVAAGEPLPLHQDELAIGGHAIEARICAENPDNDFLPATGRLDVFRLPEHTAFAVNGNGVRVDSGVREGGDISPFYDPMIAKLIVHGATREEALARLDAALAQTHIVGVANNVAFLRRTAACRSFAQADLDTALIRREHDALFGSERPFGLPFAVTAGAIVAHIVQAERALANADPWSHRDGWRIGGPVTRRLLIEHGETADTAAFTPLDRDSIRLGIGDATHLLTLNGADDIALDGRPLHVATYRTGELFSVFAGSGSAAVRLADPLAHAGEAETEAGRLTAPMPGKVVAFLVEAGETVAKGQPLAVMEAMKMEHTIKAPIDGTVSELLYGIGDQLSEGAELLRLEPLQKAE